MITRFSGDADDRRVFPCDIKSFSKGGTIYHQGDPARHWYEVVSGIVRTCRFLGDGHRQLTGFFYADDVFGVEVPAYREAAEAVTDVVLRRHSMKALDDHGDHAATDKVLAKALESARQSIFLFGHRTATNRLAAFLIHVAERPGESPSVHLPMTRGDIADHLNLTLHTVSRTISELVRTGLIALDGPQSVRILDLDGLRAAAGDADPCGEADLGHTNPWESPRLCESA